MLGWVDAGMGLWTSGMVETLKHASADGLECPCSPPLPCATAAAATVQP